nr:tripartite tricarboxylate transporter permease [Propylenella binzhouense]
MILGFEVALTGTNLAYCFLGVLLGTAIGVLPGIGALAAVSMLLPVTFYLHPTTALILLAGVYYGAEYGGSTASILLRLPGTPASAITCLDGYPMAKQGKAGVALFTTSVGSFIGGSLGIILMMVLTPAIMTMSLAFGPAEYFAIILLGLVAAGTATGGSVVKGLMMIVFGLLVGCIGTDLNTGVVRYDLGFYELQDGINMVVLAMGLFGVSEVIASIDRPGGEIVQRRISLRSMIPSRAEWRQAYPAILRGSAIGAFFGPLPGTGPSLASFMSYLVEKRIARDPSRFGKGAIEGVASPEAANNAAVQTAFIPTLALGIPGTATTAILLGAMMVHGIQPGPRLVTQNQDLFWGVIASFWIGNLLLLILNIPLIGIWVSILKIPYRLLYPAILIFICVGVYSVNNNLFDVWMVLIVGLVGYGLRLLEFEPAPLLIGYILGPLLEENLRRGLLLFRGDYMGFVQRPISAGILLLLVLLIAYVAWSRYRAVRRGVSAAAAG